MARIRVEDLPKVLGEISREAVAAQVECAEGRGDGELRRGDRADVRVVLCDLHHLVERVEDMVLRDGDAAQAESPRRLEVGLRRGGRVVAPVGMKVQVEGRAWCWVGHG